MHSTRTLFFAIIAAIIITMMAPIASFAGSRGSRNTAIGLAGLSAFLMARGKTAPAIVAAVGAGYALGQSQRDQHNDRYYSRYDRGDGRGHYRYNDRGRNDYRRGEIRVVVPAYGGHRH